MMLYYLIRHESTPGLIAYVQNTQNGWMLCRNYWKWLSHNLFECDDKRYMKWIFIFFTYVSLFNNMFLRWISTKSLYETIKVLFIKSFYFLLDMIKSLLILYLILLRNILRKKYNARCMWHDSHHMGLGLSIHKSSSSQIL